MISAIQLSPRRRVSRSHFGPVNARPTSGHSTALPRLPISDIRSSGWTAVFGRLNQPPVRPKLVGSSLAAFGNAFVIS